MDICEHLFEMDYYQEDPQYIGHHGQWMSFHDLLSSDNDIIRSIMNLHDQLCVVIVSV